MTITWQEYFLNIAKAVAAKSKDPNTKVGAIIVNQNKKIVGTGYNGFPSGYPELPEYWVSPVKYNFVIHAEDNAIRNSIDCVAGCSIYITEFPCPKCADLISKSGISKVLCPFSSKYYNQDTVKWLSDRNVEVVDLNFFKKGNPPND